MIRTDFLNLPAKDTPEAREARKKAAEARTLFGGPASDYGSGLDFTKATGPAKTSGMGMSTLDIYAPVQRADEAKRAETEAQMEKLPASIAALPKKHPGLALDALEALASIQRSYAVRGEQPVPVHRGDLARNIGVSVERAEAIINDLQARNLIQRHATAGTVPHFRVKV
jgi:hypothetical protein